MLPLAGFAFYDYRHHRMLYDGKGIRLDVYINDDKGTVYNVEMERGKHKKSILPKRSRYYQGRINFAVGNP